MQSYYEERFERIMACTEAEWRMWLPRAIGAHAYEVSAGAADVRIGAGRLQLQWEVLPERAIALIRLPQLRMRFEFHDLPEPERHAFMKRFDLYTQRGGG